MSTQISQVPLDERKAEPHRITPESGNAPSNMQETPVLEFATASCLPPDDNRPPERPGLVEAIRANTQLVPGLVCPHPELPGRYEILDGVGRWFACDRLGITFRAMLLPAAVPEAQRIKLRLQHNVIRRNMTLAEIADDAARYMSLTKCTQEEAAQELTLSSATVSRALAVKRRIPSELKPLAEAVRPSIAAMIAALPTSDLMRQALEYASTPGRNGRHPTREQMAAYLEPLKKTRATRAKTLKGTVDGRKVEFVGPSKEPAPFLSIS
jgi:ParB family transcriptional regulator, chromosome partitioning protein